MMQNNSENKKSKRYIMSTLFKEPRSLENYDIIKGS